MGVRVHQESLQMTSATGKRNLVRVRVRVRVRDRVRVGFGIRLVWN